MHLKDAFDVLGSEDLASARARGMGSLGAHTTSWKTLANAI